MAHGMATSLNPPTYPENGTYADLLVWHLFVWRTRPEGSTTQRGERPWDVEAFKEELFQGATADDEVIQLRNKNFNNWTGEGQYVAPGDSYHSRIVEVVFGNEPKFEVWISDLRAAIKRSSPKGNNILSLKIEVAIAALASSGYIPAVIDRSSAPKADDSHIAATAEQDTVVIIDRLAEPFVGRSSDIEAIDNFVTARMDGDPRGLMVITAPPGIGKSALAAYWCKHAGKAENRHIVRHFCSMSNGADQTKPEVIYEHLHKQIADVHGEPVGQARNRDALTRLLCRAPPNGKELVVWLDGIDEANGTVDCFVPYASGLAEKIGDRVCIIVSARADPQIIPAYLDPWLEGYRAKTHSPKRHKVGKLSQVDVESLIGKLFKANELPVLEGLTPRIFRASEGGWPLFVRNMIDSSIKDIREGRDVELGDSPESLQGYIKVEIKRLATLTDWRDLHPIFVFLTIAKQAVSRTDLEIILGKEIFPETFPSQLTRWLNVVEAQNSRNNHMLSFAHPLLAQTFGQQLEDRQKTAEKAFAKVIAPLSYADWPDYALRHLPRHLLQIGMIAEAENRLTDTDYIAARMNAVGAVEGPRLFANDFFYWYEITRRLQLTADNWHTLMRHMRFWNNHSAQLQNLAEKGHPDVWRQLMHDLEVGSDAPSSGLLHPNADLLANSLATFKGHRNTVTGALALADGAGFLSWSSDNTLRLWSASGEAGPVLRGHKDGVLGALILPNGAGFLSWSDDHTLRIWAATGEERAALRDHEGSIGGALLSLDDGGFFSWGSDAIIRLWSARGELKSVLTGHQGPIYGALLVDKDSKLLSWSADGTLRLWSKSGDQLSVFRGHTGAVKGVLVSRDGAGFLSWGADGTLRFWQFSGDLGPIIDGNQGPLKGVVALSHDAGFLSWGVDFTLRLWSFSGDPGPELIGHENLIEGVLVFRDARILSWGFDNTLRIWNPIGEPGLVVRSSTMIADAHTLENGEFLSWGVMDKTINLWSAVGESRLQYQTEGCVKGILSLEGGSSFLSWDESGALRLWSAATEFGAFSTSGVPWVKDATVLEVEAGFLSWSNLDCVLRLWNVNGQPGPVMQGHENWIFGALALTDDAGFLSWGLDGTLRLWNAKGYPCKTMTGHESAVFGAIVLENGEGFVSWGNDNLLRLWDACGEPRAVLDGHEGRIEGATVLQDNLGFVSWCTDRTLRLWKVSGEIGPIFRGHERDVLGVLAIKHNADFVSWSNDGTLRIWNVSGTSGPVFLGHEGPVSGALAVNGDYDFVSWGLDGTLRLWNASGKSGPILCGHDGPVKGAVVLENGAGFLSWGHDRTLRLWNSEGIQCNIWLSPSGEISFVRICEHDHYLVIFGESYGTVHLPFTNEPRL